MKHFKRLSPIVLLALAAFVLAFLPESVAAQAPDVIRAEVDRSQLSSDESLILVVTVANVSNGAQPLLPVLDGFYISGQQSSSQIRMINGNTTSQASYIYRLQPTQSGDLVIDPITIDVNGQTYATDAIPITVSQGSKPIQASPQRSQTNAPTQVDPELVGQDFFVEAEADNATPYQGEQVVYTFRFYQAVNHSGKLDYQAPAFSGLWHEQAPEQHDYMVQVAERTYRVTEIQHVLFPTIAGELNIEPATLGIPGGFFSRGQTLGTRPIMLDVQPLPAGAPAGFQGAVGKFDIRAEVDTAETTVNDTLTFRVVLTGQGNIATLPSPILPDSNDWRAFDGETSTQTWYEEGNLNGGLTTEWVLVPTVAGAMTLPALTYSYFDPESQTYQTATADPITIQVAPDNNIPTAALSQTSGPNPAPMPASNQDSALRPLKTKSSSLASASTPLVQRAGYWLLWLLPVALVAGQYVWKRRQNYVKQTSVARRSKLAAKDAQSMLRLAGQQPNQPDFSSGRILTDYLSAKLNENIIGMTHADLAELLLKHGSSTELAQRVLHLLAQNEMNRYAGNGKQVSSSDLIPLTSYLIDELDKTLVV
ncbi:MAG: protein BatD [Chloroflexi bacterium]|nr:protein BatD [Chloroflexota bacterium]